MADRRAALGAWGEDAVARWYEAHGYTVVARNWRVRRGELDIVAADRSTVVFCEVKTRSSARYGTGFDAVTPAKQQRLRGLALEFLAATPGLRGRRLRFDVAAVTPGGEEPRVSVRTSAF